MKSGFGTWNTSSLMSLLLMQNLSAKTGGWPGEAPECKEFWKPSVIEGMGSQSRGWISQRVKGMFGGVMEKAPSKTTRSSVVSGCWHVSCILFNNPVGWSLGWSLHCLSRCGHFVNQLLCGKPDYFRRGIRFYLGITSGHSNYTMKRWLTQDKEKVK